MLIKIMKVYPAKTGEGEDGSKWSYQGFSGQSETGKINGSFVNMDDQSGLAGQQIDATKTKNNEYNGKTKLNIYDYIQPASNVSSASPHLLPAQQQQKPSPQPRLVAANDMPEMKDKADNYLSLLAYIANNPVTPRSVATNGSAVQAVAATILIAAGSDLNRVRMPTNQTMAPSVTDEDIPSVTDEDIPF